MTALILTYHAVEEGPAPLCIPPERFRAQLDCLAELGVTTLTVAQLAAALRDRTVPDRAVAITFDDGCASAARTAVPALVERGMTATLFCVAGHLGGWNDWPTQPTGVPRFELATAAELTEISRRGFEIGAHGMNHAPLGDAGEELAGRELREAKVALEDAVAASVHTVAYPYGVLPSPTAAGVAAAVYEAACTTDLARVSLDADPLALPRVDVHYLSRLTVYRNVIAGRLDLYLRLRSLVSSLRQARP